MNKPTFTPSLTDSPFKDEPLEKLLAVLNVERDGVKYKKLTFARLNTTLKKMGKSKKNWDRNIFLANVMDAKNPAKYFWWKVKEGKLTIDTIKK